MEQSWCNLHKEKNIVTLNFQFLRCSLVSVGAEMLTFPACVGLFPVQCDTENYKEDSFD